MSELIIVLLLLVPVVVVVAILINGQKKRKKKVQDKLFAYLHEVIQHHGIVPGYQKQFVHQLVIVDEKNRTFLIVNYKDGRFSYDLFPLGAIRSIKVVNHKQTLVSDEKGGKPEIFSTQIGVAVELEKNESEKFLTLYDYVEHNIYHMAELEKEAAQLCERIKKALNGKPIEA